MSKFKVDIYNIMSHVFSCEVEADSGILLKDEILSLLNTGAVYIATSSVRGEELIILPRERIDFIKVAELKLPNNKFGDSNDEII